MNVVEQQAKTTHLQKLATLFMSATGHLQTMHIVGIFASQVTLVI